MPAQRATCSSIGWSAVGASPRKAYLAISPRPQAHSRGGRDDRVSVSHSTALGCQNAPTRFLPSGRLTPVLPPMAASTWASSEVATFTYAVPRW